MGGEVVGRLEDFGRLAGAEHFSRDSQGSLNARRYRVRAAKYTPRSLDRLLARRHGLAPVSYTHLTLSTILRV